MDEYALTDEPTISKISDISPRAISSYFIVLHECNTLGEAVLTRDRIVKHHMKSWTKFKNDMRALARIFIVNFFDDGHEVSVSLIQEAS